MKVSANYPLKIVLEGCNGEWAQKHYLPLLVEKAAKGAIELWAVDIKRQIALGDHINPCLWQDAHSRDKAFYLHKLINIQNYQQLSNADFVFIVTPDRYHCQIAEFWLERLASGGKIFVEKPLDACIESALRLNKKIEEKAEKEAIFGFDHYLARAYPFLKKKASYLGKIGKINKVRFHILKPDEISIGQKETLNKGMIFDLFGHVLAVVCAVVSQNVVHSTAKFPVIKLEKVKAARYAGPTISGETFAQLSFTVNGGMAIDSVVGKGVGTSEDKFMRLSGSDGEIVLDFVKDKFFVFDSQGRQREQGRLDSEHVKSFLDGVLAGKEPLSIPGVLSFGAAFEILKILDEAKNQIGKMPEYQCGESLSKILEVLGNEFS